MSERCGARDRTNKGEGKRKNKREKREGNMSIETEFKVNRQYNLSNRN